jgi:hypothetical protein
MSNEYVSNTIAPPAGAVTAPAPLIDKPHVIGAEDAAIRNAENQTSDVESVPASGDFVSRT